MGNTCCAHLSFNAIDLNSYNSQELLQRLREHPEFLSVPRPSAFLGLNESALHLSVEHRSLDAAKQIFDFLASADLPALQAALRPYCKRRSLQLPGGLPAATRMAINMANNKGQTPLMYACYSDFPEMVKLLLEQGADPWVGDNCGSRNALHYAAMSGSAVCVEALMKHVMPHLLVRQGVRYINSRSLSGLTPLHYCVFFAHEAALQRLLLYEPNINAASTGESYDTYGSYDIYSTPLHFAALQDSVPMSRMLLLHYARRRRLGTLLDPRLRANSAGKLPWQVARGRELAALLHPAAALGEVLGREGEEALLGLGGGDAAALGPPTLAALAAAALRQRLLAAVEVIERECCEEAALQRQQSRRPTGILLACSTPRRRAAGGSAGAGVAAAAAARDLLCLPSRVSSRRRSRSRTRHAAAGAVMPASPRRAPTLDRLPHPSDFATSEASAAAAAASSVGGFGSDGGGGTDSQYSLQHRLRGTPSPSPGRGLRPAAGSATANSRNNGYGGGGRLCRAASGRARGQLSPLQHTTGFLGGAAAGASSGSGVAAAGGGGLGFHSSWHPGVGPVNGTESMYDSVQPAAAVSPPYVLLNPISVSLTAGGGAGASLTDATASAVAGASGDELGCEVTATTLPGGASTTSLRAPPFAASAAQTPAGCSPERNSCSAGIGGSVGSGGGGSDEAFRLAGLPYANVLSPATSLAAGSCMEFDAAVASAAVPRAAAAAIYEGGDGGGGEGDELCGTSRDGDDEGAAGGSDDDDGTCAVCFARPEAVMSSVCRHRLCTACAGEMCRALVSKPLLCPFCRRPVANFVRMVKQPPPPPPALVALAGRQCASNYIMALSAGSAGPQADWWGSARRGAERWRVSSGVGRM